MKLIILGTGGHSKVVADISRNMFRKKGEALSLIFSESEETDRALIDKYKSDYFVIAVGKNDIREKIESAYKLKYATLVHPSAVIAEDVKIGCGTVVMAGAVINSGTRIGKHCIINTGATIDHDSIIDDFVHISPGAHLGGTVYVGKGSWIGLGANVVNNIVIGRDCVIGAGTVVIKEISNKCVVAGNPAREIADSESIQ